MWEDERSVVVFSGNGRRGLNALFVMKARAALNYLY